MIIVSHPISAKKISGWRKISENKDSQIEINLSSRKVAP